MERFFETASRIRGETYAGPRRHLESNRAAVFAYIQGNPAFSAILRRLFEVYARNLVDRGDRLSDSTAFEKDVDLVLEELKKAAK